MTREDIIKLAQEAGWDMDDTVDGFSVRLERFAALVAAAEREACAKLCESMRPSEREFDERFYIACTLNADAIRARGKNLMPLFDDWDKDWQK